MGERALTTEEIAHVVAKEAREHAERAKLEAETRQALAQAEVSEIVLEREQEKREKELTANDKHKVYVFDSAVDASSVKKCIDQLNVWHRQDPKCKIEIQINSGGGGIFDGFHLIDYIRDLRELGHEVTMVGYGMVASMAGVLLQAADRRVLGSNAFLLLHEGSLGAIGDFGDVEDRVKLMKKMHERILALFESRAQPINPKTTKGFIRKRWERNDWWLPAEDALELGFCDEVR